MRMLRKSLFRGFVLDAEEREVERGGGRGKEEADAFVSRLSDLICCRKRPEGEGAKGDSE